MTTLTIESKNDNIRHLRKKRMFRKHSRSDFIAYEACTAKICTQLFCKYFTKHARIAQW